MQSLLRKLLLLAIFCATMRGIGFSQSLVSSASRMRTIDSISMIMSSPRNNPPSFANAKNLPALHKAPEANNLRNAVIGGARSTEVNGCADTSSRYFLEKDPLFFYVQCSRRSSDGSILTTGQYVNRFDNTIGGGFLIKSNDKGIAQWTRLYSSTATAAVFTYCNYYYLLELPDGTILLGGKSLNPTNGHYDLELTHVDNAGNVIWTKTYSSKLWTMGGSGSPDFFYIVDMQQDPSTGDIFFTGPHYENGLNITRLKIDNGTIVWSNYYDGVIYDFNVPFGMDIRANDMLVFSKSTGGVIQRSQVNKVTGAAIEYKYLEIADPAKTYLGFTSTDQLVKMDNGHYLLSGKLYRYYISIYDQDLTSPLAHAGIVEVDADFNFVKASYFSNSTEAFYPGSNTRLTLRKDGSGLFSMLGNYTSAEVYVQFQNDQILSQRTLSYQGKFINMETRSVQTNDGGDLIIKNVGDWSTLQGKIEFLSLHTSDTSSDCLGLKDNSNSIYPYQLQASTRYTDPAKPNDFSESLYKEIVVSDIVLNHSAACVQAHHCDTLSLVKNIDTVCTGSPFGFTVRKNPSCNASVFLDYDRTQVQSYTSVNDSLYSFNFKTAGNVTIYGSIAGCAVLKDSVKVVVLTSLAGGKINLGPDTVICPGNTIVLHTKPGLSSYTWQDGSTDSVFVVKQPGLYFVSVVDGCGNILRDTVTVSARAAVPFDLGPDKSLCERDSVVLKAPGIFINYKWSPDYHINSLTTANVYVWPVTDTIYHVKAEVSPGCFVEDSLHIHVNHAPPVNLGADKSFCSGDSLILNAGSGFSSYTWSNGKTGQFATVYTAGNYSVIASTQLGCRSYDTMRVINIFANPQPKLGNDSVICAGTVRSINPGNFAQYSWNTGSTASTIAVTNTGLYTVAVTDNNNCKGYDSILISKTVNPPADFLPADTSFCTYGKLALQPKTSFNNYAWSNGASVASISIASAGTYWLEVKDNNHCVGRDSIVISSKDCMIGFYIPNAFTPGHDGKNDVFRPLIFGNLLQYEFIIYNRFGQIVFTTKQPGQGWDGTSRQSTNAFAWTCMYQLENEPVKFEKGIVLLLK